ncbi:nucleolar complex-associated protein-domain-containing protein [Cladochytrium replicatum]|nr:nucleolar complex-associated protein-domain-containing protein [Cladochytrium replicatum]
MAFQSIPLFAQPNCSAMLYIIHEHGIPVKVAAQALPLSRKSLAADLDLPDIDSDTASENESVRDAESVESEGFDELGDYTDTQRWPPKKKRDNAEEMEAEYERNRRVSKAANASDDDEPSGTMNGITRRLAALPMMRWRSPLTIENKKMSKRDKKNIAAEERKKANANPRRLAEAASLVLADPEKNIATLGRLRKFITDGSDHNIKQLALLTLLAVYKDIIPGYAIRPLTEKERTSKVPKECHVLNNLPLVLKTSGAVPTGPLPLLSAAELAVMGLNILFNQKQRDYSVGFIREATRTSLAARPKQHRYSLLNVILLLFVKFPKLGNLLSSDSAIGTGVYQPTLDHPDLANPFTTNLWELTAFTTHYHPVVRTLAYHILASVSDQESLVNTVTKIKSVPPELNYPAATRLRRYAWLTPNQNGSSSEDLRFAFVPPIEMPRSVTAAVQRSRTKGIRIRTHEFMGLMEDEFTTEDEVKFVGMCSVHILVQMFHYLFGSIIKQKIVRILWGKTGAF